jgi:hypothetical protein
MIDKTRRPTFAGAADLSRMLRWRPAISKTCAQLARTATRVRHEQRCARRLASSRWREPCYGLDLNDGGNIVGYLTMRL